MLRDGADARQKGNLLALHAVRIAAAIPVLVKAADGLGGQLAHAEFGDDVSASVAAEAHDLRIVPMLSEADMQNSRHLRRGSSAGKNILPKQLERRKIWLMRPRPVFELDSGLHGAVVSADNLREAAGVAAAPNVLKKERKVE